MSSFKFVPQELEKRKKFKLEKDRLQAERFLSQKIIKGNLNLSGNEYITDLGNIQEVHGNLDLDDCKNLNSLGELKMVYGDLHLRKCVNLKTLGNLCQCNSLGLSYSGINYIENENLRVKEILKIDEFDIVWSFVEGFNEWHVFFRRFSC